MVEEHSILIPLEHGEAKLSYVRDLPKARLFWEAGPFSQQPFANLQAPPPPIDLVPETDGTWRLYQISHTLEQFC